MARADTPPRSEAPPEDELVLGEVVGVFGVHGEVRLFLINRASELLFSGAPVALVSREGIRRTVRVHARPGAGDRVLARIEGVADREQARLLMGWELRVPRTALPPAGPGEFYVADLIGMQVVTESGQDLGELVEVHQLGEVDVWVARQGEAEHYIPALRENVLEVDVPARRVRVSDRCASTS